MARGLQHYSGDVFWNFWRDLMNYLALATDYDGTLATDGRVTEMTMAKLRALKESGRRVILVTGRELPELIEVFPELNICDVVVAENGAVLYWPHDQKEEILGEAPTREFIAEMELHQVLPYSIGRVIFATWRPHETIVLEVIQRLGLGYQIIFNKKAVMVLPGAINKATGLTRCSNDYRSMATTASAWAMPKTILRFWISVALRLRSITRSTR